MTKADIEFIKSTKSYMRILKSGLPFCKREFKKALKRLAWHKAQGINGISPNALKVLNKRNKKILFNFIQIWCETDAEYKDWHISMLSILPKKGDLSNPNNWRGINLLDVTSKIVSIMINTRLQNVLKNNFYANQFGATPNAGCQDAIFLS